VLHDLPAPPRVNARPRRTKENAIRRIDSRSLKGGVVALAIVAAAALVPSAALAANPYRPLQYAIAEKSAGGSILYVHGTQGPDSLRIDRQGDRVWVTDLRGNRILAGTSCRSERGFNSTVSCDQRIQVVVFTYGGDDRVIIGRYLRTWDSRAQRIEVWLGAGNDAGGIAVGRRPVYMLGGDGNDNLAGSASNETLWGGPDNDFIRAGGGADYVDGGHGGFDRYGAPVGRSYVNNPGECAARTHGFWDRNSAGGGEGVDTLDLSTAPGGALADLNVCRLGFWGTDAVSLVHGIENVIGTPFNDRLVGDDDNNRLVPGRGNDWVSGEGGDDYIDTNDGFEDTFRCGPGQDTLRYDGSDHALECGGRTGVG
jgi:Ca2+-binding RTX toxin-like protein